MTNETGICFGCKHEDDCNMHKKNPEVKVIDCQRFEMDDTFREISDAIHETAKLFRQTKNEPG